MRIEIKTEYLEKVISKRKRKHKTFSVKSEDNVNMKTVDLNRDIIDIHPDIQTEYPSFEQWFA